MHTIVYKAAAYAIEKEEELAALASTPTSNGEVPPQAAEVTDREENDPKVGEAGNCKPQGVNSGPPTSVRRALSYVGHQTVHLKPADTSLQIPVDQVIERIKAPEATAKSPAAQVDQKDEVMPVKANKARCGCSIM